MIAALFALALAQPAPHTVDSEIFDLTGWLDPNGWDCRNPNGNDKLRVHYKLQGEPALLVERWQGDIPLPTFRSKCGPDVIAGSPTVSDLLSDLCDYWWLYLKLDDGSTSRATLDLGWKGEELKAYRCEKATPSHLGR